MLGSLLLNRQLSGRLMGVRTRSVRTQCHWVKRVLPVGAVKQHRIAVMDANTCKTTCNLFRNSVAYAFYLDNGFRIHMANRMRMHVLSHHLLSSRDAKSSLKISRPSYPMCLYLYTG
jgi:hypothetical protein